MVLEKFWEEGQKKVPTIVLVHLDFWDFDFGFGNLFGVIGHSEPRVATL